MTGALIAAAPIGLMGGITTGAHLDLIIRACPPELEGTTLMLTSSLYFLVTRSGDVLGTRLYDRFGDFDVCVIAITVVYRGWPYFWSTNSYTVGNGTWKGHLRTNQHTSFADPFVRPLFAGQEVTSGFTGTFAGDRAEVRGTTLVGNRSLKFSCHIEETRRHLICRGRYACQPQ